MIRGKYSLLDAVTKVIYPILLVPYVRGFVKLTLNKHSSLCKVWLKSARLTILEVIENRSGE